jgi:hypothetical protein
MSQGTPQLFPTQQPSRPAEAKLHVLVKVGLYLVALAIPVFGAMLAMSAARFANRRLYYSGDARLAELRRHGWIAGLIGVVVWLGIPIGLGGLKKWRTGQLPPVALAYTKACEARLDSDRSLSVEGYLTTPTGVRNPCYTTGCLVALAENPPRPKVFEGAIIKVSLPLGDAPGAFRVFTDGAWEARATDGTPLDGRKRVRVTGPRLSLGMGQCSITAQKIEVVR